MEADSDSDEVIIGEATVDENICICMLFESVYCVYDGEQFLHVGHSPRDV